MEGGLSPHQIERFHDDGFLIIHNLLPTEAYGPLIDELDEKVDVLTKQAVDGAILDPANTFREAPFATRLGVVSNACSDRNWVWRQIQGKSHKTAGMFTLRTSPSLLDAAESLIGPEILAHPQTVLRAKLPDHEETVVPWHQDLGYLNREEAGETLFLNFWIPLVKATAENGCMQVMRRSHTLGLLEHERSSTIPLHTEHTSATRINIENLPDNEIVTCEVDVGDVLLTRERLVHRSTPNVSDTVRWSLDTRYSAIGLPTGRKNVPGFVARSHRTPESVAKSHHDWIRLLVDAGVDAAG